MSIARHIFLSIASLVLAAHVAAADRPFVPADRPGPALEIPLATTNLRCEYLVNPPGIDEPAPRLSWEIVSRLRGQKQTAYHILVASSPNLLRPGQADLWDSGKMASDQTAQIVYAGKPLGSGQRCFWTVVVWDKDGHPSAWSEPAMWSMGLLRPTDWKAQWISFRDKSPVHADRDKLHLPPAHQYRKEFPAARQITRATLYATALGIYEMHLNGQRIGDAFFTPGWADYRKRNYYNTYDVTRLVRQGDNCIGATVADGWYAGYVGYALLVGYGPNHAGRNLYGKTPALLAQLDIEYADGTRELVVTDATWQTSDDGPIREADFLMGETFDARLDQPDWCKAGFRQRGWEPAIPAADNGSTRAMFSDTTGDREVELGFIPPARLQAYPAQPIRITQELKARRITEPRPGAYIFDLGENFAGIIRLKVKGPAGKQITIRYGEMLHPDGRLMTENLRRARAVDTYILRGDPAGEIWSPRFTYHGFQYVELIGPAERPDLDTVTGLALQNDTPMVSTFECSDEVMNQFHRNVLRTQRANFIEIPTDCPQRDERLGWMGDAQIYARTATLNADVAAFFTKWMDDVVEAQRSFGAYPDYCPYPMSHGEAYKTFGTAWTDAGIIVPWTILRAYGDTRIIEKHYDSYRRFMEFREAACTEKGLGVSIGNPWGDWLNVKDPTPIEFIDTCYHANALTMMTEMAGTIGRKQDSANFRARLGQIKAAFQKTYMNPDGSLKVDSQTAYVLALSFNMLPDNLEPAAADRLVEKIEKNGFRMSTGFLGTKPLLPVLSTTGHHDLAVRLFQSRQFPSWGYEVVNGATSVWERWDSFTKEDGFGRHNAAMNSYSHYSFGAVQEWAFRYLAGIDTFGTGYDKLTIHPGPPAPSSNPDVRPIDHVKAGYHSIHGLIAVDWQRVNDGDFAMTVTVPANTTATVHLPAKAPESVTESGRPLDRTEGVKFLRMHNGRAMMEVESGTYRFEAKR
ncbi:MAG: family 78 glycoside hydrolase catalytic domain [Tepidisphaeraceae bacterium]|jgi:alpha-L-rhamnosidase